MQLVVLRRRQPTIASATPNAPSQKRVRDLGDRGAHQFVLDGEAVILGVDGISRFQRVALRQTQRRSSALRL